MPIDDCPCTNGCVDDSGPLLSEVSEVTGRWVDDQQPGWMQWQEACQPPPAAPTGPRVVVWRSVVQGKPRYFHGTSDRDTSVLLQWSYGPEGCPCWQHPVDAIGWLASQDQKVQQALDTAEYQIAWVARAAVESNAA